MADAVANTNLDFPLPGGEEIATVATNGKRFGARMIDNILFIMMIAFAAIAIGEFEEVHEAVGVLVAVVCVALWAAVQGHLAIARGQSLGKLALSLRVVRLDGSEPGFFRGFFVRELLIQFFSATRVLGFINGLSVLGKERRTLHDRALDTVVVDLGTRRPRGIQVDALVEAFA